MSGKEYSGSSEDSSETSESFKLVENKRKRGRPKKADSTRDRRRKKKTSLQKDIDYRPPNTRRSQNIANVSTRSLTLSSDNNLNLFPNQTQSANTTGRTDGPINMYTNHATNTQPENMQQDSPDTATINTSTNITPALNQPSTSFMKNTYNKPLHAISSPHMKQIVFKKYTHAYHINPPPSSSLTRTQLADLWSTQSNSPRDIILHTKYGFLLKSDSPVESIQTNLKTLEDNKHIKDFKPITQITTANNNYTPKVSFSSVICTVDLDITDMEISNHLKKLNIIHHFCKRIVAKSINAPIQKIRMITSCIKSHQKLLQEGVLYKNKHFPLSESHPPPPLPMPCFKCHSFSHRA